MKYILKPNRPTTTKAEQTIVKLDLRVIQELPNQELPNQFIVDNTPQEMKQFNQDHPGTWTYKPYFSTKNQGEPKQV